MKKHLLIFSLLFIQYNIYAQDIAILTTGDTLVGKIKVEDPGYIFMKLKKYPERNDVKIPTSSIKMYAKEYFNDSIKLVEKSDLIIISNGDSIKARKVSKDDMFYNFRSQREDYTLEKKIPISVVTKFVPNYYIDTILYVKLGKMTQNSNLFTKSNVKIVESLNKNVNFLRLGFDAGIYNRLARIPSDIDEELKTHYQKQLSGIGFNATLAYYFLPNFGLGFDYLYFKTGGNTNFNSQFFDSYGNSYNVDLSLSDNTLINHYYPYISAYANLNKDKTIKYFLNLGIGYQTFNNNGNLSSRYGKIEFIEKGSTFGVLISNNFDFALSKNVSLGLRFDYSTGLISKTTIKTNGEIEDISYSGDERISLQRLNASLGLKFHIF